MLDSLINACAEICLMKESVNTVILCLSTSNAIAPNATSIGIEFPLIERKKEKRTTSNYGDFIHRNRGSNRFRTD